MSISRQEEIISVLWFIAALLAFGFNFELCGWGCIMKSGVDLICSIDYAIKEAKQERMDQSKTGGSV